MTGTGKPSPNHRHGHQPSGDKPLDLSNPPRGGSYSSPIPPTCVTGPLPLKLMMTRGGKFVDERDLPFYGETRIVTHDGRVTSVETTVKEKVE